MRRTAHAGTLVRRIAGDARVGVGAMTLQSLAIHKL
jgi:hypothetical protein